MVWEIIGIPDVLWDIDFWLNNILIWHCEWLNWSEHWHMQFYESTEVHDHTHQPTSSQPCNILLLFCFVYTISSYGSMKYVSTKKLLTISFTLLMLTSSSLIYFFFFLIIECIYSLFSRSHFKYHAERKKID